MAITKTFEGYIVLDWNKGKFQNTVLIRKPKKVTPFEIPIKISIDVSIPDRKELIAKGKVELSETKVGDMIIESI